MRKIFSFTVYTLFTVFITLGLSACGGDDSVSDDVEQIQEGSNNTSDVAVTDKVTETSALYAVISGIVNVDQITTTYSSIEFGIEISSTNDFYEPRRVAASGLVGRSFSVRVTGLQPSTKYYYRTYVDISSLTFAYYGSTASFTTAAPAGGGGTDNGHDYVNLGLPSGLKWATCNIGADKPQAYGSYFAWGETTTKSKYDWINYKWGTDINQLTKYCNYSKYGKNGFTDDKETLESADDAAHVNWGGQWRMPTKADFEELKNSTKAEWVENYNSTGVKGYRFTSSNGNHIFLPAAGYRYGTSLSYAGSDGGYWSSSLSMHSPNLAYYLSFDSGGVDVNYYNRQGDHRNTGHTVRPVRP